MPDATYQAVAGTALGKRRLHDTGGAMAPEVWPVSAADAALMDGMVFAAGSPLHTASALLATPVLRCLLDNPAGSGVTGQLSRISVWCSVQATLGLVERPTGNLPVGVRAAGSYLIGSGTTAKMTVTSDNPATNSVFTGGTPRSSVGIIPAGTVRAFELPPMLIPSGQSVGVQISLPTLVASTVCVSFVWSEAPS